MTPAQALEVIEQFRQGWAATGRDHDLVREAVATLNVLVTAGITPNGVEDAKVPGEVS